jgi:adenine deaminase
MNSIEGIIVDFVQRRMYEGKITFDSTIVQIEECKTSSTHYIMPGFVDAHVHIESSMLTPYNYVKEAIKHGCVAAVTDPHEIANVCGVDGVEFMVNSASKSPMKIATGVPSCVPATFFETAGSSIDSSDIETLFQTGKYSHLSEMMNFPGVISRDTELMAKLAIAQKYNKPIDGHAPLLQGDDLLKYASAGISTDHECTAVEEALEKISLGMKIMLRRSSASNDFVNLLPLLNKHASNAMFCTDDCHPDDLIRGYIDAMVKTALQKGYDLFDVLQAATATAVRHYGLKVGLLQEGDAADFIVVDNLTDFNVIKTVIDGKTIWDGKQLFIEDLDETPINQFFINTISKEQIAVPVLSGVVNGIEIIPDSLLTKRFLWKVKPDEISINSSVEEDVLKIVVLNRYQKASPAVGFIKGFGLKEGAIAGSIAHDSHNIIAVGVDDYSIVKAVQLIQESRGGLAVVNGTFTDVLPLPVAGLMSTLSAEETANKYTQLVDATRAMGCQLHSPFMTMAFMALLVIPEIKIGDKGLFDVTTFQLIELQQA